MRLFRRRTLVLDPIGWDEKAQRVHDMGLLGRGVLLHHSTCWCRSAGRERDIRHDRTEGETT